MTTENTENCGVTSICCHRVEWNYEHNDEAEINIQTLPESEEERITKLISEDYNQGELCYTDDNNMERWGWWKINN